ncbi:uncharacterized protein AB9X84_024290 isoform 1-T1 [Acanthopagrus schlegelii]
MTCIVALLGTCYFLVPLQFFNNNCLKNTVRQVEHTKKTKDTKGRMSLTTSQADGVTVLTFTTGPESSCPPLCQIIKGLCYSPVCCSVSQHLRRVQRYYQSLLGALHIMIGLLNIGLGEILISSGATWWQMDASGFRYWLGGMYILFGIVSILTEKYPSPCLVILNVILNLAAIALGIAAIVLYMINIGMLWVWRMYHDIYWPGFYARPPYKVILDEGQALVIMFVRGINAVLIVLSILEICVAIASFLLGITALRSREKREDESNDEPEHYKELLEEVTSNPST